MRRLATRAGALACTALCACSSPDAVVCSTGRTAGTSEGEGMAPGRSCIGCHAYANAGGDGMEAPIFAVAGTVYETPHEPDDCVGGSIGVTGDDRPEIEVITATGAHHIVPVSEGGNFMLEATIAFPIRAGVRFQGRTRWMSMRQAIGECNGCHTVDGKNGARGRIELP